MPANERSPYATLAQWAADRADMRIICACGRTINLPAAKILERFGADSPVTNARLRLRCTRCRRRGHATIAPVPILRR